ncbi:MAG TPA: hypothetical protein VH277_08630, partial [Gemmatimonadaceae bacterium]|nr:hypothetical protein [Gemmatimonadaceae bacterium]
ARVGFQPGDEPSSAVCIVSKRPDDRSLVMRVGEIFRRQFAKDVGLDVLFLTADQETDIARVCSAFYRGVG